MSRQQTFLQQSEQRDRNGEWQEGEELQVAYSCISNKFLSKIFNMREIPIWFCNEVLTFSFPFVLFQLFLLTLILSETFFSKLSLGILIYNSGINKSGWQAQKGFFSLFFLFLTSFTRVLLFTIFWLPQLPQKCSRGHSSPSINWGMALFHQQHFILR